MPFSFLLISFLFFKLKLLLSPDFIYYFLLQLHFNILYLENRLNLILFGLFFLLQVQERCKLFLFILLLYFLFYLLDLLSLSFVFLLKFFYLNLFYLQKSLHLFVFSFHLQVQSWQFEFFLFKSLYSFNLKLSFGGLLFFNE